MFEVVYFLVSLDMIINCARASGEEKKSSSKHIKPLWRMEANFNY